MTMTSTTRLVTGVTFPEDGWEGWVMKTAGLGWAALIYKPGLAGREVSTLCALKAYGFDGPDDAEGAVRDAAARMCVWWKQNRRAA